MAMLIGASSPTPPLASAQTSGSPLAATAPSTNGSPSVVPSSALPAAMSSSIAAPVTPVASPIAAPPPISEILFGDAKRDYDAGRLLYDSGDFLGARLKFDIAFEKAHDPRLLWNAAACERRLRHYAKAVVLVHRYLDSHSPLITPEAARTARSFLDAAEPLTARLDVRANEPDATVVVDDEPVGTVPLAPQVRVDLGTHRVVVKKHDFHDYEQTVTVLGSADVRVTAVLQPMEHEGRVVIRAGARNAIAVDGVVVGGGTWQGLLPSGPHSLRVTPTGLSTNYWRPFESQFTVVDDQTRVVDVNIIDVLSQPSKVEVAPRKKGIPAWAWIVGSIVVAAGASVVGYFIYKSTEPQPVGAIPGTIATFPAQ
jgi:hypothetical protein